MANRTNLTTLRVISVFSVVLGLVLASAAKADLAGWWKLDETSGTIAYDSSPNGNNGTLVGNPQWVTGRVVGALEFDGDDWVNIGSPPELVITGAITITCWINPAGLGGDRGLVGLDNGYAVKTLGTGLRFTTPGILDHSSTNITLQVGTWQHVAATFQPGQNEGLVFYLNGVETERMTSSVMNPGTGPFRIGSNQWSEPYTGLIDDVRVYNNILSSTEIEEIMLGEYRSKARAPDPADGTGHYDDWVLLSWTAAAAAVEHDVYFGADFDDVNDATASGPPVDPYKGRQTDEFYEVYDLVTGTTYYWRIDEVEADGTTWKGNIWGFTATTRKVYYVDGDAAGTNDGSSWINAFNDLQDGLAAAWSGDEIRVAQGAYSPEGPLPDIRRPSNPNPADGATSVSSTADLSWTADSDATSHDVYFGTTSPGIFQGNQTATTFDPGTMDYYTTYYWRIDELNNGSKTTGTIWSFLTASAPPPMGSNETLDNTVTVLDRTATFQLKNGVVIKGGYAGLGEPDPNTRDIDKYETILSGDLADNDEPNFVNYEENSYHVVTGSGTDATAVLDGFTITAGNANQNDPSPYAYGGGMYNKNGSPTLTNCIFSGNSAYYGGGMYNYFSSPTLTNCTFSGNSADDGGGMVNWYGSPALTNCIFSDNSAEWGGGMANWDDSSPTLSNCTFVGNSADVEGGGMGNWYGSPALTNCIFSDNSAEWGGGMFNLASSPTLVNCTFSDNSADIFGGGIYNDYSSRPTLANCILWGNTAPGGPQIYNDGTSSVTVSYSDVQGGWPGTGNINANPLFVDPAIGDYHLLSDSPCIDAGDPSYVAEPNETDLDGNPRFVGGRIDMGAYEFQNTPPVADAGPDQIVECACNTAEPTMVTLDGSGSYDADGDPLTFTWSGPFIGSPAHGITPTVTLEGGCPGDYVISLVVNDGLENSEPNEVLITVVDTTPPQFQLSVAPTMLWPPDHKMVEITPSWTVSDDCDATPQVSLVGIVANEGDNTIGDGHTSNDIQIGADGSIYLRSERSGTSDDRVYTITYQAIDECGNTTLRSATVSIPHDFKVLARIASRWLWAGSGRIPEDLNGDGFVNLKDIAIFANNWIQ